MVRLGLVVPPAQETHSVGKAERLGQPAKGAVFVTRAGKPQDRARHIGQRPAHREPLRAQTRFPPESTAGISLESVTLCRPPASSEGSWSGS